MGTHPSLISNVPACHIVTASKELVDALLAMNTRNRDVRQTAVARLETDVVNAWELTASGIGISREGVLLDGQHRLIAIRNAGYPPVQFLLVVGLRLESQAVVDRHAKRGLADAMTLLHSRTIGNSLVAAANALLTIKHSTSKTERFVFAGGQPSDATAMANVIEWEQEIASVLSASGGGLRAPVVAALAIYMRHDELGASELANQLKRKTGLQDDDPAYRLDKALGTVGSGAQETIRSFALTVSAICSHAAGKKIKMLRPYESWSQAPWRRWLAQD